MITPEQVELAPVSLPEFGLPDEMPTISSAEYAQRIEMLREKMEKLNLTHFVVFGDREHSANIAYLSGYDPRFEEALLIVDKDGKPRILVGNEGMGYLGDTPAELEHVLYQSFSLLDQSRSDSATLNEIFSESGIGKSSRIGCAGWKYFNEQETPTPDTWLEIPSFIVDTLREMVQPDGVVINANAALVSPADGLRTINSVDQLALFEFGAAYCSQSIRNVVENLRPGMTELQGVELMKQNGIPQSCHPMLTAGPRAFMGLPSPSSRVINHGEPYTTALGYWGGLSCRNGWVIESESELPENAKSYLDDLVKPYFALIANYYNSLRIGAVSGEIYAMTQQFLEAKKFQLALNPGHLIHIEEWLSSPFYEGSNIPLRSGTAMQIDLIPVAENKNLFSTNIEDTVAIADEELRNEIAGRYPAMWKRIQARREFMTGQLGIDLPEEVLPFSNLAARLSPFQLSPNLSLKIK